MMWHTAFICRRYSYMTFTVGKITLRKIGQTFNSISSWFISMVKIKWIRGKTFVSFTIIIVEITFSSCYSHDAEDDVNWMVVNSKAQLDRTVMISNDDNVVRTSIWWLCERMKELFHGNMAQITEDSDISNSNTAIVESLQISRATILCFTMKMRVMVNSSCHMRTSQKKQQNPKRLQVVIGLLATLYYNSLTLLNDENNWHWIKRLNMSKLHISSLKTWPEWRINHK